MRRGASFREKFLNMGSSKPKQSPVESSMEFLPFSAARRGTQDGINHVSPLGRSIPGVIE